VIDNASAAPVELVAPATMRLTVVRNDENVGFAVGCNQGASGSDADALLFLNPDTRLGRYSLRDAVKELFLGRETAPENGAAGVNVHDGVESAGVTQSPERFAVGLPLVDYAGRLQATCGPPLTARRLLVQTLGLARLAPALFGGMRLPPAQHAETGQVGFASGAALLVQRSLFDAIGRFDPGFVIYLEDADLCARAAARGWSTWLVAGDPVVHRGGWSTGRHRSWRLAHSWRSTIHYARKHFGGLGRAAVIGGVLLLAPLVRIAPAALRGRVAACVEIGRAYFTLLRLLTGPRSAPDRPLATERRSLRQE
jgi:GT2 family glycosyltransferase